MIMLQCLNVLFKKSIDMTSIWFPCMIIKGTERAHMLKSQKAHPTGKFAVVLPCLVTRLATMVSKCAAMVSK